MKGGYHNSGNLLLLPLFTKKGKKTSAGNYRPVSLTCVPCKVLEDMIREKILDHLEKHGFENVNQHGFTKVKSCLINLLETLEDVTSIVDEGNSVDMIYLDYA